MAQDLIIAGLFGDSHAFLAEYPRRPHRIRAARLDIDKEQVLAIFFQRHPHVFRFTGVRVEIAARQHTADLILRIHLVGDFGR